MPYFPAVLNTSFTILNILREDASDGCKLQEVPFIDLQLVDIRLLSWVISVQCWGRKEPGSEFSNLMTNVNTRVGVGRRYHGDMTILSTTPCYWLCCFNRKLGHYTQCRGFHMGGLLVTGGGCLVSTLTLFVWVSFRKLTAAARKSVKPNLAQL